MQADGKGWLFAPAGLVDGPLPTHYEPQESPVRQPALPRSSATRSARSSGARETRYHPSGREPGSEVFPYVAHHLPAHRAPHRRRHVAHAALPVGAAAGVVLRGLARARRRARAWRTAGWATIVTARTAIEARVLVTERIRPLEVQGRRLHQIGLPYHWGANGLSTGDSANDLSRPGPRPERAHPGGQGADLRHPARAAARAGPRCVALRRTSTAAGGHHRATPDGGVMSR